MARHWLETRNRPKRDELSVAAPLVNSKRDS
jgi:hypothetical protein